MNDSGLQQGPADDRFAVRHEDPAARKLLERRRETGEGAYPKGAALPDGDVGRVRVAQAGGLFDDRLEHLVEVELGAGDRRQGPAECRDRGVVAPLGRHQTVVRICGPDSVTTIVCSKWAARAPSLVATVQPSSSTWTSPVPKVNIGSIARHVPGSSSSPRRPVR